MAVSGTVNYQDMVLYTQYNNLRSDVLDPTYGHTHSGSTDGGALLTHASMANRTRYIFINMGSAIAKNGHFVAPLGTTAYYAQYSHLFVLPADFGTPATVQIPFTTLDAGISGSIVYSFSIESPAFVGGTSSVISISAGTVEVGEYGTVCNHSFDWAYSFFSPTSVYGLSIGSPLFFSMYRYGTAYYDTVDGTAYIGGFLLKYTADM